MGKVTLIGFPQSSYVWTSRAALTLKGIDHEFRRIAPGEHRSEWYLARHPYGKVPLLETEQGDLFETSAILRWAESQGSGPSLYGADSFEAARIEQWVSVLNCYLYERTVPNYLFKYPRGDEGEPDRAAIDAVVPRLKQGFGAVEARIDDGPWLVGDQLSAADIIVGPMLFILARLPEGQQILAASPKLGRLRSALAEVEPFMASAYRG